MTAALEGMGARFHHVGIIVPSRARAEGLMRLLGLRLDHEVDVPAYEALCLFTEPGPGGVEFIVPRGGVLAQFNHGQGGLHHTAFEVDDLAAAAACLRAQGIELLEQAPVAAGRLLINFIPPAFTRGLIVELVQDLERENIHES